MKGGSSRAERDRSCPQCSSAGGRGTISPGGANTHRQTRKPPQPGCRERDCDRRILSETLEPLKTSRFGADLKATGVRLPSRSSQEANGHHVSPAPTDDDTASGPTDSSGLDEPEQVEELELDLTDAPAPAVDLLHTYVRQIGDGALLTHAAGARAGPAQGQGRISGPRIAWSRPTCGS